MDRLIYTAMTGASTTLDQHATVAHNLANVGTNGFRAQMDAIKSAPLPGPAKSSMVQVTDGRQASDFTSGPMQQTGRALDVAILGSGWLVVQGADGSEAMTRGGALSVSSTGVLQTQSGLTVLGDSGPISIPIDASVTIGKDGTVSVLQSSVTPSLSTPVGRLKLVNPPVSQIERGQDGLFRLSGGEPLTLAEDVTVSSGVLESSNVNVVDAMVKLISLGRQFDMNMQMLKNAESNEAKASQVLNLG
jgi:flagellar basal-body rod protein FlgF